MIEYTDTTVFNVNAQTMVNTINCMGVMGAGLALEFRLRFPEMYEDYLIRCERGEVKIGRPYLYRDYDIPWIMNFPTKYHWKRPSKIEWIEQGLRYFVSNYERGGIVSIAFPKLGSNRGGLDWKEVKPLMERYLKRVHIQVYICLDREHEASGIEGIMVGMINNLQDQRWISDLKIRRKIAAKIVEAMPISRFYELREVEGVGEKSYEKVFKFFYAKTQASVIPRQSTSVEAEAEQLELISN